MKILLVEDDRTIASGLEYSLQTEGYEVMVCENCAQAEKEIATGEYALYLLDLTLPDGSGYDLCRKAKGLSDVPVIFLTACDEEVSVVMGLDMGADDYVTKPFRLRELLSRIKSVLRRANRIPADPAVLNFGNLTIQPQKAMVLVNSKEVALTALEYRLLLTFAAHPGQILTRSQLLEGIWDIAGNFVNDNTLSVYIKRLREKLAEAGDAERIATVRGLGYRMEGESC